MSPELAVTPAAVIGPTPAPAAPPHRTVVWGLVAAAGVLVAGLAAFMVSPKLGLLALGVPAVPVLVLAPDKAVLLVLAALPFDAVASIAGAGTITLTRLLGMAVLGGWVLHVLVRRRQLRVGAPGYVLLAYVAFAAASTLWAEDPAATMDRLQTVVQLLLFYLMVTNLLADTAALERALDVWLSATAAVALLVLWQFPSVEEFERATLRLGQEHFNQNYLAATFILPALAAAARGHTRSALGWWRLAALVPIGVATIITGSRGGAVAFAAGLAVLGVLRPRIGLRAAAAAVLAVSVFLMIVPSSYVDRLTARYANSGEDRMSGRVDIWKVGVAMMHDRPLQGTGFAGFEPAFYRYMAGADVDPRWALENRWGRRASHNIYLSTLAELGLLGGGLLFAAFAAHAAGLWRALGRTARSGSATGANAVLGILCAFVGLLTVGATIDVMLMKTAWLVLALSQAAALTPEPTPQGVPTR